MSLHEDISESSDVLEIELQRRHVRRKRLIIFGAPNDLDDKKFVQELSKELQLEINIQNIKKNIQNQNKE